MRSDLRLGFICSSLPKKCGIATFSRDLIDGIKFSLPNTKVVVVAAEKANESYVYGHNVVAVLKDNSKSSYRQAATVLNQLNLDAVLLQHEFGLFGGKWTKFIHDGVHHVDPTGDNIFALLNSLNALTITTMHTVLPYPDPDRKEVTRKIANHSTMVVTMSQDSKRILCADYQIEENKIVVIHHGVPNKVGKSRSQILKDLNLDANNFYLVITGLMSLIKALILLLRECQKYFKNTLMFSFL